MRHWELPWTQQPLPGTSEPRVPDLQVFSKSLHSRYLCEILQFLNVATNLVMFYFFFFNCMD